ncbi:MAG: 50S ribosomal protein L25 [Candidatus Buchananbacteria bacterium]
MTLNLNAKTRKESGKKVQALRDRGSIPAVIYGHGQANQNLELNYIEFEKVLKEAGESTIIDLSVDGGAPIKTIVSEVQFEPVKGRITHTDLHRVNMKEKMHATIPLNFIGESRAVKEDAGVLVHNISELEVRCLPTDLVHEISVDITPLNTFDDVITLADLKIPATLEVLHHHPQDAVVNVARPKIEVEEVPAAAPAVEGEVPAEGETAAPDASAAEEGKDKK